LASRPPRGSPGDDPLETPAILIAIFALELWRIANC
jgi:hypothetical protein